MLAWGTKLPPEDNLFEGLESRFVWTAWKPTWPSLYYESQIDKCGVITSMGSLLFPTVTNLFELSSYRLKAKMTQLQVENQLDQRGEVECCYRKMGGAGGRWKCWEFNAHDAAFFQPDKPILRKFSFPFKLSLCILGWVGSYVQCWVDLLFKVFSLFRSSLSLAYVKAGSSSNVG